MDIHKNARLTPHSRGDLVRRVLMESQPAQVVAAAFGVCSKTVCKWVERFQMEGEAGLQDRSSRPHRLRRPTPQTSLSRKILTRRLHSNTRRTCSI
jgi:transposase